MAKLRKIPTPFRQQLRRFRYQLLPVAFFGAALVMTAALWGRQRSHHWATGEVYAVSVDLTASQDGLLVAVAPNDRRTSPLLASVHRGEIVAQLDGQAINAELEAMTSELAGLRASIDAEIARLATEREDSTASRTLDARRLTLDTERLSLDLLDRHVQLQADRILLVQSQTELEAVRKAHAEGAETDFTLQTQENLRDAAFERVSGQQAAIKETQTQLAHTRARLDAFSDIETIDDRTGTLIEPIRHSIAAQQARIRQLELSREALAVQSPIDGKITMVHSRPGQAVRAGDPIVTVTAFEAQEIISYLREGQNYRPKIDDKVAIRSRSGRETYTGRVVRVGATIEPIPPHQLQNPDRAEWGLPVSIALASATALLPGELVDITFTPTR